MTNLGIIEERAKLKWQRLLSFAIALVVLFVLGIAVYGAHVRSSAQALIDAAESIRSTADADREIAIWQKRSRESSWENSSAQTEDRSFDTRVENGWLHRLHICPPTAVALTITMRKSQLRSVILVMFTESRSNETAGVWVQEWFDSGTVTDFYVKRKDNSQSATVEFSSTAPEATRERAFALNADCLVKAKGCKTAQDILPGIWGLGVTPN